MIDIENTVSDVIKITVSETLKADDFQKIAPQIDKLVQQYGKIRILIDASKFNGWENVSAFEKHISFIKSHHQKIERGALIAGHAWQHWIVSVVRMFIHPEIKVYDKGQDAQALQWVIGG